MKYIYELGCVIIGVIAILLGKFFPNKPIYRSRSWKGYRDTEQYVKATKKAFVELGIIFIILGVVKFAVSFNPSLSTTFNNIMPILILVPTVIIVLRYFRKI